MEIFRIFLTGSSQAHPFPGRVIDMKVESASFVGLTLNGLSQKMNSSLRPTKFFLFASVKLLAYSCLLLQSAPSLETLQAKIRKPLMFLITRLFRRIFLAFNEMWTLKQIDQ